MCVSMALPFLVLLPLTFLSPSAPRLAQGALVIPQGYKANNISQPPVLTMPSEVKTSYTAFSRDDIDLPCEASGNPPPTFRWVKDGRTFESERTESGTLEVNEDEELEFYQGTFRCYASNMLGTAMTQTVHINVEAQPVVQKQKKFRRQAYVGESMVLSCTPPSSSSPPVIHWMDKKMVHIRQSDRVTVGLNGNLYFANLLKSDSRLDYICNAQYTAARTILPDTAIALIVLPSNDVVHGKPPHIFHPSGSHSSVLALRGQTLTLECIPKGLPTPKVEWKKKDGNLDETSAHPENYNRWLYFDSISQSDDGEYECRAFNTHGSSVHSYTVTVEAAPYWVKEPQNLRYAPGETVRLDCLAEGIPTPNVTWSINGQPLSTVDKDTRRSVSGGVLKLKDVLLSDTAVYQCEAANKHGSILINAYLHVVELPPQILSADGVVYRVTEGGTVKMSCETFGSPLPHVKWDWEDWTPLLSDPRVFLLTNGTLELSDVGHSDSGTYTCVIKNTNISINAHLEVFNKTTIETAPQNVRALRGGSAVLDCHVRKDPRLLRHQIIWRKDGQKLDESSPDDKYTVFENGTLKVTDIQSQDNAAYSCEVITELDQVTAGGSVTVVARPDPPQDVSLTDVKDDTLTLSWIPGRSHNSPITEFIVEAKEEQHSRRHDGDTWRWQVLKRVSADFNHLQLSLRPFCTYAFRVVAVNQLGLSDPSRSTALHSTPPAVPHSNPTGVRSESSDAGTLAITWDEMPRRLHNGQDFQYKVLWRKAGDKSDRWNHDYTKSPPFLVNNTGTYEPFEIKVQAVNTLGEGPAPEAQIGHSGEDVPEESPSGVEVHVMNSTIAVSWNEAQKVRGRLLGYKIYIRRLGPENGRVRRSPGELRHLQEGKEREGRSERGKGDDKVVVVQGMKTATEVTGLQLFSRYTVCVTAFNSKGESPASLPVNFSTPEGVPGPPSSLVFESPSENSMLLYWSPPLQTNGILLGYMVQYQREVKSRDSPVQIELIPDPSVTHLMLDSLDPHSYYTFQVIARTAAGDGQPITRRNATLFDGVPPRNITVMPDKTSLNLSWVPGERERNHGFHIDFLKKSAGGQWKVSEMLNSSQGFYSLTGLQPGTEYHLVVMHGNYTQWEAAKWTLGPGPSEVSGGFANQGWLIGLISAIVLLILILLILCLVKRRKGGKYAVKDKEEKEVDSEAKPMKDETFGEYSDTDEKRTESQPSLCGDSKLGSDDSLAEYGDSVDIQFNEDGSFIGQYSGRATAPAGNESSGPTSPDNTAPPPPIAPSMSSILNRPN
ncbi:neural cell adhesion molecule L1.1-like isoform X1 [Syngnathoides biaculeatus]|uniref:neural cell adhesion molecule L1.1-like isoform X1 n=2 Tax=Syngnathoides biaculeatus TaxID=300417 RepID=UPI002ADD5780|nr:neural cell adhesion molecule L1.1-like isoform X1 [Syngnathoides biaculeatus]XP_061683077.1 neural cell adhesion molecule L1.1-like isoform X1 [Syngnathoides biaculeatus]XP_061683086.1 neural cell adhesion molecule L1.1-like isoform X1 [Syngnathoides biaculeatus]